MPTGVLAATARDAIQDTEVKHEEPRGAKAQQQQQQQPQKKSLSAVHSMARKSAPLGEIDLGNSHNGVNGGANGDDAHPGRRQGASAMAQLWNESADDAENVRRENVAPDLRRQTARKAVRGGRISSGVGRRASVSSASSSASTAVSSSPVAAALQQNSTHSSSNKSNDAPVLRPLVNHSNIDHNKSAIDARSKADPVLLEREAQNDKKPRGKGSKTKAKSDDARPQAERDMGVATAAAAAPDAVWTSEKTAGPAAVAPTTLKDSKQAISWQTTAALLAAVALAVSGLVLLYEKTIAGPTAVAPTVSSKSFFHAVSLGEPFSFELDVEGEPAPTFQWRLNGVNVAGATSRVLQVESVAMRDSGTYSCVVENEAGRLVWEEGYLNVIVESEETQPSNDGAESAVAALGIPSDHPLATSEPPLMLVPSILELEAQAKRGDSTRVRQARTCLLRRAPDLIMRAASIDGGSAVIAAGDRADYLACFPSLETLLQQGLADETTAKKQEQALDMLRALHGTSRKRSLLVNVIAALDDLAKAKLDAQQDASLLRYHDDLLTRVAFHSGLYCASTLQCASTTADRTGSDARTRFVGMVLSALTGA